MRKQSPAEFAEGTYEEVASVNAQAMRLSAEHWLEWLGGVSPVQGKNHVQHCYHVGAQQLADNSGWDRHDVLKVLGEELVKVIQESGHERATLGDLSRAMARVDADLPRRATRVTAPVKRSSRR